MAVVKSWQLFLLCIFYPLYSYGFSDKTYHNVNAHIVDVDYIHAAHDINIDGDIVIKGTIRGAHVPTVIKGPGCTNSILRFADDSGTAIEGSSTYVDDDGNITLHGITKNNRTVSWPSIVGSAGTFLGSDGAGNLIYATPLGAGNVTAATVFSDNGSLIIADLDNGVYNVRSSTVIIDDIVHTVDIVNSATSEDIPNTLVLRDGSGNFATTMITIDGTVSHPTDAATKAYVDSAVFGSIVVNDPAVVVSTSNIIPVGIQTIDGILLSVGDRVLLVGQDDPVENGLWLVQLDAWVRPIDFSFDTVVNRAYIPVTAGLTKAGSSWLANPPDTLNATIDADPIFFVEFGLPSQTAAASTGTGEGVILGGQTGLILNLKTIAAGLHLAVTNNADDIMLSTNATSDDVANTLVARDGSGNFSAGIITASLSGNVTGNLTGNAATATSALTAATATAAASFSGSLGGDVTGTQGVTVVGTVGGQTAAQVASGASAANVATHLNTASTIVQRDALGNFSAGTITASLTGNITGNLTGNATTAGSAANFSGLLAGDITGTQSVTVVALVGGQIAANIASATVAANAATSNNMPNTIVKRDSFGNFTTNDITITGPILNPTDAATKQYVDTLVATGFDPKDPAVVVNLTNIVASGVQTIDGVSLSANDRVLLAGQTNPIDNGLWLVQGGAWIRPADFSSGTVANLAYVLILSGTVNAGSSWICSTPDSIVDTDSVFFAEFSLPSQTTAANVGVGAGQIFKDKTGVTLNLKTIAAGPHVVVTNNTNDINLATDATNDNTATTIVSRDGTGNFSAGIITASLSGNATTATTATSFSGLLAGDVTGTQDVTVVGTVGGETAAQVASGAVAANAATNLNTASTIVKRDGSGNFSAGTITATLTGNVTGNLAGNATTATTATSFSGLLVGDVTGTQDATVVGTVGGQTAAIIASGAVAANAATNLNTASTIVKRDGSGNFSAGVITANLTGNATTATSAVTATSATTATSFSGLLAGDVTGTQGATVVDIVGGQTAAQVASGAVAANAATNLNTASTIVKRDGSGNFSAGTITASLSGNATTATSFSGSLAGDVTGPQSTTVVNFVGGQAAAIIASGAVAVNAATNLNTASTIVKRDASGNFSAGIITANLTGDVTGNLSGNAATATSAVMATTATSATTAASFSGLLAGDVTGTQGVTVVGFVGGQSAAQVASGAVAANAATNLNTVSTIVKRDGSGNFSAGTITASLSGNATTATTATNFSGSLVGDVTGTQGVTVVGTVGGQTATIIASGAVAANAATNLNTASTIVKRDGSGNFSAGTITATLTGAASLNVLKAGDTMTGSLRLPAGSAATPSLQFTGSTNTGISAATANTLSFDSNGVEEMSISGASIKTIAPLVLTNVHCDQAVQSVVPTLGGSVTTNSTTSVLLLNPAGIVLAFTVIFPPKPTNGQLFTISLGTGNAITLTNVGGTGGASIVNGITGLNPLLSPTASIAGASVSYWYFATANAWYRR